MSKPTPAEIAERCTYHPPTPLASTAHERIRLSIEATMNDFVEACPESRELSLAITKLEEAMFWANAAVARNHSLL